MPLSTLPAARRPVRSPWRAAVGAAAAMAAAWSAARGALRCFSSGRAAWPDTRLWVSRLPDGSAVLQRQRDAASVLAFDAFSRETPGTREVAVGGERFWAYLAPRLGAEHLVVWRREDDVRAAHTDGNGELDARAQLRVTSIGERPQLTAPMYMWDVPGQKDEGRYWDDSTGRWMYWESFWAPAEEAALAAPTPAFGDAAGHMLAPLLDLPGALAAPEVPLQRSPGLQGEAVASTSTAGVVPKDQAYSVIYKYNVWGSDESRSGTGSDKWSPEARLATTALDAVINHFGIRSMIDCACGDATWMVPFVVQRHPEVSYTGIDIVGDVIEANKRRHPGLNFMQLDLSESPLPTGADLVFSKETMNHMPLEDALNAIARFRATGARFLLTNVHHNSDNEDGRGKTCYTTYAKYDYELPPFSLTKVASIIEYQGPGTSFSLFEL